MSNGPLKVHFDNGGRTRCGHGTKLTADEPAVTCERCLDLLAGTYHVGTRRADVKPCGTLAAVKRHQRHGERACESCLQVQRRYQADRRARERKGLAA